MALKTMASQKAKKWLIQNKQWFNIPKIPCKNRIFPNLAIKAT